MNYKEHMDGSKGMTQLFIKLLRVLEAPGAYCKHHLSQAILEKVSMKERSTNYGIFSRVFTKAKNLADSLA
ncbi:hypothetical protein RHGRI_035509 [Rhododendron griersonianum]|uniref:Uncharacterized protein n=1 Tax=Rhododendron griersonianum TaxID=479676 RepID=A0AAV6HJD7_9ERIC|nr:hypothetical protein RHGRI_035509 [Rhododendron griersonianum]